MGVLGGFLGQLMICLNTIAKHFAWADMGRKTKSARGATPTSRPKTPASEKSAAKSSRSQAQSAAGSHDGTRHILNNNLVQHFIYTYINEKLKTEKLWLHVSAEFEEFLNSLSVPLQLNEMRTMKEHNYEKFRELLRTHIGSPALKLIRENQDHLAMDPDVFDLVYEGFWDLYTFHPKTPELSAKKLQQWIQRIQLTAPEREGADAEEGEEGKEAQPADDAEEEESRPEGPCAVVRIKVAKQKPDP